MICTCGGVTQTRELKAEEGFRKLYEKCPKCGRVEQLPLYKLTDADLKLEKFKEIFIGDRHDS